MKCLIKYYSAVSRNLLLSVLLSNPILDLLNPELLIALNDQASYA